jgi:hypothetical protein
VASRVIAAIARPADAVIEQASLVTVHESKAAQGNLRLDHDAEKELQENIAREFFV